MRGQCLCQSSSSRGVRSSPGSTILLIGDDIKRRYELEARARPANVRLQADSSASWVAPPEKSTGKRTGPYAEDIDRRQQTGGEALSARIDSPVHFSLHPHHVAFATRHRLDHQHQLAGSLRLKRNWSTARPCCLDRPSILPPRKSWGLHRGGRSSNFRHSNDYATIIQRSRSRSLTKGWGRNHNRKI